MTPKQPFPSRQHLNELKYSLYNSQSITLSRKYEVQTEEVYSKLMQCSSAVHKILQAICKHRKIFVRDRNG